MASPEMKNVVSGNIEAVGYDAETRMMRVRFHNGGVYDYADVPPDVHESLMAAKSKGSYLASAIKGKFSHSKG